MKKYLLILMSVIILIGQYEKAKKYKELYTNELINVRAYEQENSDLKESCKQFNMTIDELRLSKDSINKKVVALTDELKIKDKNIQSLQYQTTVIEKTDTIVVNDTIFKDTMVPVDTVIGDNWYSMKLSLRYPSTIVTSPSFKSEKYIVVYKKKEYYKKPSKIFFIRWFQKKYTTIDIDVIEKNPYIENKEHRFINITK